MAKAGKNPSGRTATNRKKKTVARSRGAGAKAPFTRAELERFKNILLERRRRILATVNDMEEEALKAADQDFSVDHMADHGSDNYDQDLTLSLVESERQELYEIDRALLRLANGVFGICEGTGQPIPKARLEAIPYARYSVDYQRALENGQIPDEEEEEQAGEEEGDEES